MQDYNSLSALIRSTNWTLERCTWLFLS